MGSCIGPRGVHHKTRHHVAHRLSMRAHDWSAREGTFYGLPSTGDNCDGQCMLSYNTGTAILPLGIIPSLSSWIDTRSLRLSSIMDRPDVDMGTLTAVAPGAFADRFTFSPDTTVNDYYATYTPPQMVTVGGFNVPVVSSYGYFSPFKHRNGEPMRMHNHKGESLLRGGLPESIGTTGYTATSIER
jgi:hypothetical protein